MQGQDDTTLRAVLAYASPQSSRRYRLLHHNTFPQSGKDALVSAATSDEPAGPPTGPESAPRLMDLAESIPDDCWTHIFSFLPCPVLCRVMSVCRTFRRLATDPELWHSIDVRPFGHRLGRAQARVLLLRPQALQKVNLEGCSHIMDYDIACLVSDGRCRNLEELGLSWCCRITDEALVTIAESCPRLARISINHCRLVVGVGLYALSALTELRSMSAAFNFRAGETWAKGLLSSQAITELDVRHCARLPLTALAKVATMSHITTLCLRGCTQLDDRALLAILRGCELLESLDVGGCRHINEDLSQSGATVLSWRGNSSLRSFRLRDCYLVDDQFLSLFRGKFPKLRAVDLSNCFRVTDEGIVALLAGCSDMTRLFLNGCRGISDGGLHRVLQDTPALEEVELANLVQVTSAGVRAIAASCRCLRRLSLRSCFQVTDDFMRGFVQGPGAKSCQELCLNNCFRISDAALVSISLGCPSLRRIDITNCDKVGISGMCAIVNGCRCLRTLISPDVTTASTGRGGRRSSEIMMGPGPLRRPSFGT